MNVSETILKIPTTNILSYKCATLMDRSGTVAKIALMIPLLFAIIADLFITLALKAGISLGVFPEQFHLIPFFSYHLTQWSCAPGLSDIEKDDRQVAVVRILDCYHTKEDTLILSHLRLRSLPSEISQLTWLTTLELAGNQLQTLPDSLGNLRSLTSLTLSNNQLQTLPDCLGNLRALSWLDLSNNQLRTLPDSFGNLSSLTILRLSNNQLRTLPDSFGNLSSLTSLFLSNNQLQTLPDSLGNLSSLTSLILHDNQLRTLPDSFGNLSSLTSLAISNNQLQTLPDSFDNLSSLTWLFLSNYQLRTPVPSITSRSAHLPIAIKEWMDISAPSAIDAKYNALLNHANKDQLTTFLTKLRDTADYRSNPQLLRTRIQNTLNLAASHVEVFYKNIGIALTSCGDRLIHELDNVECELMLADAGSLDEQKLADFLLRLHRLRRLDGYVLLTHGQDAEAIESSLKLRILLKNDLPIRTEGMSHEDMAQNSAGNPAAARSHIYEDNTTIEQQAAILCKCEQWTSKLSDNEDFAKSLEQLTEEMEGANSDTDGEQLDLAAICAQKYKELQFEHTKRILLAS